MDLNAEMLNLKAWKPCLLLFWPALCLHALQQNNSSVCRLASAQVGSWSSLSLARRDPVARPSVESLLSLQSCQDTWKLSQRFCLFPVSMTPISLHSSPIHLGGDLEERGERKLTVVSHCASQLAGINLRSTTALNLGCFCSRNHKRRES